VLDVVLHLHAAFNDVHGELARQVPQVVPPHIVLLNEINKRMKKKKRN
jgi:hypothetical protein